MKLLHPHIMNFNSTEYWSKWFQKPQWKNAAKECQFITASFRVEPFRDGFKVEVL